MRADFIEFAKEELKQINEGKSRKAFIKRMCPECGTFQTAYPDPNSFAPAQGGITVNLAVPECSRARRKWHEASELDNFAN